MYRTSFVVVLLLVAALSTSARRTNSKSNSMRTRSRSGSQQTIANPPIEVAVVTDVTSDASRPGATVVLTNSGTVLSSYSQILTSELTVSSGVQCNGGPGATSAEWILPNGEVLGPGSASNFTNVLAESNPSQPDPNVELLRNSTGSLSDATGVYWCIVEYESYKDTYPVWIVETSTPPLISKSSCQFGGLSLSDNTFGVYFEAEISNGAPSMLSCTLGSPQSTPLSVRLFRTVSVTRSPTQAAVRAVADIPLNAVPSSLMCTVNNTHGSNSFACDLQTSTLRPPVIESIIRESQIVTVTWSSVSGGTIDSYSVYVVSTNGVHHVPFRQILITNTQAEISGLHPGFAYEVVVVALTGSSQVIVPPISSVGIIPMSQCVPAQGQNIEIKLTKVDDSCLEDADCSDRSMDDNEDIVRKTLAACGTGEWNCTAMDPVVTKVYCNNEESTPNDKTRKKKERTSTKNSEDIKIKAMAICNACTATTLSNEITATRRTSRRNGRSSHTMLTIDNVECSLVSVGGCQYSVAIDTKSSPQSVCGGDLLSSSSRTRSRIRTCDCPGQCYQNFTETCANSCC